MATVTELRIETLQEKKLIGKRLEMNYANNRTFELWSGFMPRRKEITNNVNAEFISMQVYDASFNFHKFELHKNFDKWAAIEVSDFGVVPQGMETFVLPSGLYVVFLYKGLVSEAAEAFNYIFNTWIPNSKYAIDTRPHFEIIGEKYKRDDPSSEEEIWIPIKPK